MTDDDKALVKQAAHRAAILHASAAWGSDEDGALINLLIARIEALSAENERLREALGWFLNDSRFVVQVGGNPYVVPQMIEAARAALGETK